MKRELPVIQSQSPCCLEVVEPSVLTEAEHDQMLAMFKALADGTRLEVFRLIASQQQEICACDVVDRFSVSQPTIAHHLKVLRQAGLITSTKRGIWAYYAVDPHGLQVLGSVLSMLGVSRKAELAFV